MARIRHAHGDPAGALETMGEAGQAELSPQLITLLNPVPAQRARLLLAQGDVGAAAQWTMTAGLSPDDEPDYPREPAYLVLARVLLAQNDPGPALALLERLLGAAAGQGRAGSIIEIQALRALALAARGAWISMTLPARPWLAAAPSSRSSRARTGPGSSWASSTRASTR